MKLVLTLPLFTYTNEESGLESERNQESGQESEKNQESGLESERIENQVENRQRLKTQAQNRKRIENRSEFWLESRMILEPYTHFGSCEPLAPVKENSCYIMRMQRQNAKGKPSQRHNEDHHFNRELRHVGAKISGFASYN